MTDSTPGRRYLAAFLGLLAAGLLARLAVLLAVGFDLKTFDVDSYHWHAMESIAGRAIPSDYHPVGTSWLLALFYRVAGIRPRLFLGLQALMGVASAALVGIAARKRWGDGAGLLATGLLALLAYPVIFSAVLSSETLGLFGVALVVALAAPDATATRTSRLVPAAFLAGLTGFVRTGLVALSAAVAALAALSRRRFLAAALLVLAFAPMVLFAALRARTTGVFRLSTPNDVVQLFIGNNRHATGRVEYMPDLPQFPNPAVPDRETLVRILKPQIRSFFLEHPGAQLRLVVARARYLFAPPKRDLIYLYGTGWSRELPGRVARAAYAAAALSAPLLFSCVLLAWARAGDDAGVRFALGLAALGALPYLASVGDARYLLPIYPALAFASGALFSPKRVGEWSMRRRVVAAVAAVLLAANGVSDVRRTDRALAVVTRPGGTHLKIPYHFAP